MMGKSEGATQRFISFLSYADQVGLSGYFRDLTNQKPLRVPCLGGFSPFYASFVWDNPSTKQPVALKSGA
jgi:hypothetical protein